MTDEAAGSALRRVQDQAAYPGGVPLADSTWPARYSDPVIRMRGGTS